MLAENSGYREEERERNERDNKSGFLAQELVRDPINFGIPGNNRLRPDSLLESQDMTWDMRLGMLVGIAVVVAIALVYFKPEGGLKAKEPAAKVQGGHRTVQLSPMPK